MPSQQPEAEQARIADLHPTQITLGLREVAGKRLRWRCRLRRAGSSGPAKLIVPVVRGPQGRLYLTDRHHLLRAAQLEGIEEVVARPLADFSAMQADCFWETLDTRGWCHPFDAAGRRRPFSEVPGGIAYLADDPYRSLASALRRLGGFAKTPAPFSEFAWADHLRRCVGPDVLEFDFDAALDLAMTAAAAPTARHLPGWRPAPSDRTRAGADAIAPHATG